MHRIITDAAQKKTVVQPNHPEFKIARQGIKDMQEIAFIVERLGPRHIEEPIGKKIQTLVSDAALPQDSGGQTPGRDMQFELYVMAICNKAGMRPRLADSGDIVARRGRFSYCVEVKRIKDFDRLEDRFRKASDQIEKSGFPGYVVVDISIALNKHNEPLVKFITDEEFERAGILALREFVRRYFDMLQSWREQRDVRGIVLMGHLLRQHPKHGWGLDSVTYLVNLDPTKPARVRDFESFSSSPWRKSVDCCGIMTLALWWRRGSWRTRHGDGQA